MAEADCYYLFRLCNQRLLHSQRRHHYVTLLVLFNVYCANYFAPAPSGKPTPATPAYAF